LRETVFSDRLLLCRSCGVRFLHSAAQQRAQAEAVGASTLPTVCPGCVALRMLTARHRGVVKWYDGRKGYGFIREEEREVFVHRSGLVGQAQKGLRVGQSVEFDVAQTERGLTAQDVTLGGTRTPPPSEDTATKAL
jgi:cold shock protein